MLNGRQGAASGLRRREWWVGLTIREEILEQVFAMISDKSRDSCRIDTSSAKTKKEGVLSGVPDEDIARFNAEVVSELRYFTTMGYGTMETLLALNGKQVESARIPEGCHYAQMITEDDIALIVFNKMETIPPQDLATGVSGLSGCRIESIRAENDKLLIGFSNSTVLSVDMSKSGWTGPEAFEMIVPRPDGSHDYYIWS